MSEYIDITYSDYIFTNTSTAGSYHVIENGPGNEYWLKNNQFHRTDGPARIQPVINEVAWYIHGKSYRSNKEYQEATGLTDEEMAIMILKYGNVR